VTGIAVILIGCSIALPTFDKSKLEIEYKTSYIYDKDGNEIMSFQSFPGEPAHLSEIPQHLQDALVAVEDNRFKTHNGIDFRAIGRAVYRDIITGSKAEGGSTITQQLAKNVYLSHEKTFTRKIREIALAAQIERNYSKDDILEMYFNRITFAGNVTGVKYAAEVYFDKGDRMQDLTLAECALLAGLPNAPTTYNPRTNPELSIERRDIVLDQMLKYDYITKEQYDQAINEPLNLSPQPGDDIKGMEQEVKYPYYLDYVLEEAEEKLGIEAEQILRGGVKVYTNLDPKLQDALQQAYEDPKNFPRNAADGTWAQAASVIVDPETGGILALVGGRDKPEQEHTPQAVLNRASMAQVRPGSSFKPIIVYAPAIDTGKYTSSSMLNNKEGTEFPGGYKPRNWKKWPKDKVTMNEAIVWSLNIPAVSTLYEMGVDVGYSYATKNFGIPLKKEDSQRLGVALGDVDVTPLDLAGAYTAFANNGVRTEPFAIREIQNGEGETIASIGVKTHQAIKPDTAKVITKMLKNAVEQGTGTSARIPGRDVAGKTGTTEMGNTGGNRDAWFAGYTPGYVMVTWMGFDHSDEAHYLGSQGSEVPAALFSKVMQKGLQGRPAQKFDLSAEEKQEPKEEDDKDKAIINDLSAKLEGNKAVITWSPVDVEGAKYFLFRAEKNPDGTVSNSGGIGELSQPGYTDNNIKPGKTYLYSVVVMKGDQKLSTSNFAQLIVPGQERDNKPDDPKTPQEPNNGGSDKPPSQEPTTPTTPVPNLPTQPGNPTQPGTGGTTPHPGGEGSGGTGGTGGTGDTGGTTQPNPTGGT
jgi:penicillin-binding protein 2A